MKEDGNENNPYGRKLYGVVMPSAISPVRGTAFIKKPEGEVTERDKRRDLFVWILISTVFFLNCLFLSFSIGIQLLGRESHWLPISLHSVLKADYSADRHSFRIPAVEVALIDDLLTEENATDGPDIYATLETGLNSPVPTVTERLEKISYTPTPSETPLPPGNKSTPSSTPTPTSPSLETAMPSQSSSSIPTLTETLITSRNTLTPTHIRQSTATPTIPSGVATKTPTLTPRPSHTIIPTSTSSPTSTVTNRPPTITPTNPPPTRTRNPYPPPPTKPPYP